VELSDEDILRLVSLYEADYKVLCEVSERLDQHMNSLEGNREHYRRFVSWSGTQILLHALVMCRTKTLGIIEDLKGNLKSEGEVIRLHLAEKPDEQN
jgi:hypothetical protein